jgi:hypothetical protein
MLLGGKPLIPVLSLAGGELDPVTVDWLGNQLPELLNPSLVAGTELPLAFQAGHTDTATMTVLGAQFVQPSIAHLELSHD